uniref:DUF3347 domain-containing protein n=1 Tax=Caenorhabditis tropicalis TaxID=1561998 RepID=A0A1I7USK3_9PELO
MYPNYPTGGIWLVLPRDATFKLPSGIIERVIHQLETLPDPPPPLIQALPVVQVIKKELAKTNKVVISKTSEVAEKVNQPFKEVTSVFAGCQASQIKFTSPESKIDGADWATTDLKASRADFKLECDIFNRWTYISDIPGLEGKIYPTNEVSCLLVPIITESNQLDFETVNYEA